MGRGGGPGVCGDDAFILFYLHCQYGVYML